jgi:class 3 adenylate cyclase
VPTCVPCGHENPPAARFCNGCGEPLDIGGGEGREARKTVTVLFCDVVGSTALAERHDPEVMRAMMARFYAAARAPIERHGGRVEKVIGDALVAVFGVPVVREDDALRAVRAALEMRDAVRAMGEVRIRIGVNTGEVLARDATARESLVVGDAVNVAARLEQAAPPGAVLVGAPTWALVDHAARGERVPDISAKGKREPLAAWRVDAVDPGAGAHRRRLDLPIVGREFELGLLRLALQRAQRVRRPHLVTLVGQPGIGKSRLVAELPRLGHGLTVCAGHCRATPMPPLTPLLEAARAGLGGERAVQDAVAAIMDGDDEAATVAACLSAPDASAAPDVAWAALRLFGALASARSVAIVLEDVHWADDELLAAVEQLVGRTRRGSLLVVCTARPEFVDRRPAWASAASNAMSLALERLDDVETRRLLTHASPGLEPDLADGIVAAAEGNPLFAEHLAAVAGEGDRARGAPASIHGLLAARLEALPAPEREVAEAAAVVGRDFRTDAAEALVGRSIVSELDRLAARELIDPLPPERHQFAHALLHEAA